MKALHIEKDLEVLCFEASSFPEGIKPAFEKLREALDVGDTRTYIGISKPDKYGIMHYKAAVLILETDEKKNNGLELFTIQKGIYLTETIKDWEVNEKEITKTFQQLLLHPYLDPQSYCIEWYDGKDLCCMVKNLTDDL